MRHHLWQQLQRSAHPRVPAPRSFTSSACLYRTFKKGDLVILRPKRDDSRDGLLIKLHPKKIASTHHGTLNHTNIMGKKPRQTVNSSRGVSYRIHEPTLAEYVRLSPRLVTPIYPPDANLIVSLLDIHVDPPSGGPRTEPPLEILEAGTGHGGLTLHLSRAIHAANYPFPTGPPDTSSQQEDPEDAVYLGDTMADSGGLHLAAWKRERRAVVHTLDISFKYTAHARETVQGFRDGMYYRNIEFHVGDVSEWINKEMALRKTDQPFLSHVILDLPEANTHFANISPALHVNGTLAVFNPSITQIAECINTVREHNMPYLLEQVIELGAGMVREWDVRAVRVRANLRKGETRDASTSTSEESVDPAAEKDVQDGELAKDLAKQEEKWVQVCRPKVGQRVVGGGFLGLWRRMEKDRDQSQRE